MLLRAHLALQTSSIRPESILQTTCATQTPYLHTCLQCDMHQQLPFQFSLPVHYPHITFHSRIPTPRLSSHLLAHCQDRLMLQPHCHRCLLHLQCPLTSGSTLHRLLARGSAQSQKSRLAARRAATAVAFPCHVSIHVRRGRGPEGLGSALSRLITKPWPAN